MVDADDFSPALAFDLTFLLVGYPDRLQANVQALGQLIGLDAVEQRILAFCVLLLPIPASTMPQTNSARSVSTEH